MSMFSKGQPPTKVTDDFLRSQFLQLKCETFCLIEASHSGTMLDLDYDYKDGAMVCTPKRPKRPGSSDPKGPRCVLLSAAQDRESRPIINRYGEGWTVQSVATGESKTHYEGGSLTLALISALKRNPSISFGEIVKEVRQGMRTLGLTDVTPCLSASYKLDLNTRFCDLIGTSLDTGKAIGIKNHLGDKGTDWDEKTHK